MLTPEKTGIHVASLLSAVLDQGQETWLAQRIATEIDAAIAEKQRRIVAFVRAGADDWAHEDFRDLIAAAIEGMDVVSVK